MRQRNRKSFQLRVSLYQQYKQQRHMYSSFWHFMCEKRKNNKNNQLKQTKTNTSHCQQTITGGSDKTQASSLSTSTSTLSSKSDSSSHKYYYTSSDDSEDEFTSYEYDTVASYIESFHMGKEIKIEHVARLFLFNKKRAKGERK
jgi:hypothetical protein